MRKSRLILRLLKSSKANKFLISIFAILFSHYAIAVTHPAIAPGQLQVQILQAPTPVLAENKFYLVYELYLTNFSSEPITLKALDIKSNDQSKTLFHFADIDLKNMITFTNRKSDAFPLTMNPSISKVVYMWLSFDSLQSIPPALVHHFTFDSKMKDETQRFDVTVNPIEIQKTLPISVAAPLKGDFWVASNGLSNTSGHRQTIIVIHGRPYLAQRYAIDFIQINPETGLTYHDDQNKNANYYCYNKEVFSAVDGDIVGLKSDIPENKPHSSTLAIPITEETIGGNNVVIEISKNKYAFYGHLIPGSNNHLHVGDHVKVGDVVGRVGNTGNSSEPHLHFHIVDSPSFLAANGIPYAFNSLEIYPKKLSDEFKAIDKNIKWMHLKNQLVLENSIVNFSK